MRAALLHFVIALLVFGCGSVDGNGNGSDIPGETVECSTGLQLRVVVLDIWGRRLPQRETLVNGVQRQPNSDVFIDVTGPSHFNAGASSPGFVDGTVGFDVLTDEPSVRDTHEATGGAGLASSTAQLDGCTRLTVYVGLDHPWFAASGRPPWPGNEVDLLMDGEEFWSRVHGDLVSAVSQVRGSTWWWQSNFELVRPPGHESMSADLRLDNTILRALDGVPAVKRLLINRFLPDTASGMAYMNTDPEIRARAQADGDGFEVLLQGSPVQVPITGTYDHLVAPPSFGDRVASNPEFASEKFDTSVSSGLLSTIDAASYHQKAFVIDGEIAYVGGMNIKSTDWDTHLHSVFESRRMKFDSSADERSRVAAKLQLPDLGPRKDYGIRVRGPAALEADDVMKTRWDLGLKEGDMYWEHASPFQLGTRPQESGDVTCQVVATMPPPIAEQSILETWAKALSEANSYIYIEDQYFRMPVLNGIILDTMTTRPWVTLVVVTKPVSATDGGKKYTVESDAAFRANVPDRYLLLQLKSFDAVPRFDPAPDDEQAQFYFVDMDVHSKILIVDDTYLSVGSCNKNNRGVLYEGELNVSVLDAAFTRDARRRIYENLVGPDLADQVTDDPDKNFALLRAVAKSNAEVEKYWSENGPSMAPDDVEAAAKDHRPDGFVYPLSFTPDYLLEVGPDVF